MAGEIIERRVRQLNVAHWSKKDSPFCLVQLTAYETDDPANLEKKAELLNGRIADTSTRSRIESVCNLGGCSVKIVEDLEHGRKISGQCRAANYCLKSSFEAVAEAPTVEEGKALYADICGSLEEHHDKYNAGNFCPNLNCGLSAGVSIDMVPGTAGECLAELNQDQQVLDVS